MFLYRGIKYNIFGLIPKTSYVTQTLNIKYHGTIEPGLCVDRHLPMCRGTIFLHIYRGPPYSFAQNIPLNPNFMGHRFNPMLTFLLRHSNSFDQSNRVLLPKRKGHAI